MSASDRLLLEDLCRVRLIDEKDADAFHYSDRQTGSRKRLERLTDEGLLKQYRFTVPGRGEVRAYGFANKDVAKKLGGRIAGIDQAYLESLDIKTGNVNRLRNGFHELITSKIYFAENRPDSFCLEIDFDTSVQQEISNNIRSLGESESAITYPDAVYRDASGDLVMVEADSGQYTSTQIKNKLQAWRGQKQVWGQPTARTSAAEAHTDARVHKF